MKAAIEHVFNGVTGSITSYTSSITSLGTLFRQYSGSTSDTTYVAPLATQWVSPGEISSYTTAYPHAVKFSDRYYWIFMADIATAAATRRITMFQYDRSAESLSYYGSILLNHTTFAGNKTSKSVRGILYRHTTGTVSVANSANVTGSGTAFQTERLAVGARIAFGTDNAASASTWYNITAIASDTALTIDGTVSASLSTPYIIEELRIAYLNTNATTPSGGFFIAKGLNPSVFAGNTSIADATTVDNIRATYFLRDASPTTMSASAGFGLDNEISKTEQYMYVLNAEATTTARFYKFNIRAALTVAGGATTSAYVYRTGQATTTGTITTVANGRICTISNAPASGDKSYLFTTTTRIYRCSTGSIVDGGTSFLTDAMVEIPPGTTTTYPANATLYGVDYSDSIDRLIITTNAAPFRMYVASYKVDGLTAFEKIFAGDLARLKSSTTSANVATPLQSRAVAQTVWTEDGIMFGSATSLTAGIASLYVYPIGADWEYASSTNQYVITPKMATLNATALYRAYVNNLEHTGTDSIGSTVDPIRLYVRTSGIDDNSGGWTLLGPSYDLTGITPGEYIQFKIEFKVISDMCLPSRVYSIACVYEDGSQDYHYEPSLTYSSAQNRVFAWRQGMSWGSNIPNLQIRLFNIATGLLVLDDDITSSASGTWEYSTNGTVWNVWSAAADTVGNYIRYTATSLPNNITVRALLTQA